MKAFVLALLVVCQIAWAREYRTFDGSGNNVNNTLWGAASTAYFRSKVDYSGYLDGFGQMVGKPHFTAQLFSLPFQATQPNPRNISNILFGRPFVLSDSLLTDLHTWWGKCGFQSEGVLCTARYVCAIASSTLRHHLHPNSLLTLGMFIVSEVTSFRRAGTERINIAIPTGDVWKDPTSLGAPLALHSWREEREEREKRKERGDEERDRGNW